MSERSFCINSYELKKYKQGMRLLKTGGLVQKHFTLCLDAKFVLFFFKVKILNRKPKNVLLKLINIRIAKAINILMSCQLNQ